MRVQVIVPWRSACPYRIKAWSFLRPKYPWPVIVAPGASPWIKAAAIMPAVQASKADILVIADADVWTEGLAEAVAAVASGAHWAVPHREVHRLTEPASEAYMRGDRHGLETTQPSYAGIEGGGYVVLRRETFLEIPMDPRFIGWGGDDWAWGFALFGLLGECCRGSADLIHLWHPPQERMSRKHGSQEGFSLWTRYRDARWNPDLMRQLVQEARAAFDPHQPPLHDHPTLGVGD